MHSIRHTAQNLLDKVTKLISPREDLEYIDRTLHNATVERKKAEKKLAKHLRRTGQDQVK